MIIANTDRLILREYHENDMEGLYDLCSDPEVMKYFPKTLDYGETEEMYQKLVERSQESGKTFWAMELKKNGDFVGFTGLAEPRFEADFTPCTEIGWRVRRKYWRQGLAYEAAKACLDVAWYSFELNEVVAMAVVDNIPSIDLMKKLGMQYLKHFSHPELNEHAHLQDCILYNIQSPKLG